MNILELLGIDRKWLRNLHPAHTRGRRIGYRTTPSVRCQERMTVVEVNMLAGQYRQEYQRRCTLEAGDHKLHQFT